MIFLSRSAPLGYPAAVICDRNTSEATLKAEAAELALRAAHPNSHVALSTLKRPIPCTDRREQADCRSQLAARENSAPVTF